MKFIQTLISDGMSMNSLKPSIKSESEGTLDSCIMKEAPVSDCVLSKEINSQNNGEKDLCLTGYEIGSVGNTTKKMFEQVDLNSSISNSEVPVKKDSWNSGDLYDNTSEKENMESTDVRYDALSDDDNESIHLKISSDDENSIADSETLEQNSPCNKRPGNSMDEGDVSRDLTDGENAQSHSEVEDDHQTASNELSREEMNSSSISGKDTPRDSDETEEKLSLGVESDHEDSIEEFEPMPSSSESQLSLTNYNNTFDTMVSEEKSTPTSPETLNSKKDSEILESNHENTSEESLLGIDQNMLPNGPQSASECDSSPSKNSVTSDAQLDVLARVEENSREAELSREENFRPITLDGDPADTEKEVILLSDDANDSDSCVDSSEINGLKINDQKTDEESNNENLEEETVCSGEFEETETVQKDDENPESTEVEDSMNGKGKLLNAGKESDTFLEGEPSIKESSDPEEKFLEILEYQPINEEGEELREIQTDKDIQCEVEQKAALTDENLDTSDLCAEKQNGKNKLPLVLSDSKDTGHSNHTTDTEASPPNSPEANADHSKSAEPNVDSKEQASDVNECDTSVDKETVKRGLQRLVSSDYEVFSDTNNTTDNAGVDSDIKCPSNAASAEKTEPLIESCEAQSGRKRASCSEDNLVICSKRTKVAITEKEENESEIVVCEEATVSDYKKKCTEVDTKEKRDTRAKRLSNSVSDEVEVKKIRVMPEASRGDKGEKASRLDKGDTNLELVKKSEVPVDSRKESDNSTRPLPFLRTFSRAQLQSMSRNDLEELVLQKVCEAITERSECGELRELSQSLEEKLKIWQKKSIQLTKQVKDLNVVLKRYASDLQSKGPNSAPLKITRSVGLQVQMPGVPNASWNPEESTRRKSEKSSASTSSASSSVTNSAKASASSPVSKPTASNVHKVSEADVQVSTTPTRQNSQSSPQSAGVKVLQSRSPASSNTGPASTNKTSNKSQPPSNNRVKSSSDLQVIDLTDAEEKTKNNSNNSPAVSSTTTTVSSAAVPVVTTTIASNNTVPNVTIANMGRPIRVVQHLGGSAAPILTQSGANTIAGQRVAYFVPTTSVPSQQRQLIISSSSQVRPAGVVTMSRQNPLPTIVLKPGQVVPVSSVTGSTANILRTSGTNSSIQLASPRVQPRTGQLIQRFPVNASPVQSPAVAQPSGLSVSSSSSSSHPAPLPPTPPSGPNNTNWKRPPPKPDLKISKVPNRNQQGIVLSWNMTVTQEYEEIASYQLFAYQEGNAPPSTHLWKKVGDVKALPLPMACTLTQFMEGHKYHFAVRAVDVYARYGPFSAPGNIVLTRN